MGVLKFRLYPRELAERLPELRQGYVTGFDRTPGRTTIEVRSGMLLCHRENPESGRLHVSWPVEGFGTPVVSTATLGERAEPYDLGAELARGRLNDVRNMAADLGQVGFTWSAPILAGLRESQRWLARAVTSRHDPAAASEAAGLSLQCAFRAGELMTQSLGEQLLARRLEHEKRLPTLVSCTLEADPRKWPVAAGLPALCNAGRIRCHWGKLAPSEGSLRFDEFDQQLAWCKANKLTPTAGPLLDMRPAALPDWLWLWGGDFEEIQAMVIDLVRQVVGRYRGKVAYWHLVHRMGVSEVLGLNEEEQIRLIARSIQVARQADPGAQLIIDFERPWSGWLSGSTFQLGPLHLADSLARAELGLAGIGLEIAPGYSAPGSQMRDLFEFSRLLDLYALVNLPIHVSFAMPSASSPDAKAAPDVQVRASAWPGPVTEASQQAMASQWVRLALAKPQVRSINWSQTSDATAAHLFPHAGLFRPDHQPKPLVETLRKLRGEYL